jgi:hypothetical protein
MATPSVPKLCVVEVKEMASFTFGESLEQRNKNLPVRRPKRRPKV